MNNIMSTPHSTSSLQLTKTCLFLHRISTDCYQNTITQTRGSTSWYDTLRLGQCDWSVWEICSALCESSPRSIFHWWRRFSMTTALKQNGSSLSIHHLNRTFCKLQPQVKVQDLSAVNVPCICAFCWDYQYISLTLFVSSVSWYGIFICIKKCIS